MGAHAHNASDQGEAAVVHYIVLWEIGNMLDVWERGIFFNIFIKKRM